MARHTLECHFGQARDLLLAATAAVCVIDVCMCMCVDRPADVAGKTLLLVPQMVALLGRFLHGDDACNIPICCGYAHPSGKRALSGW